MVAKMAYGPVKKAAKGWRNAEHQNSQQASRLAFTIPGAYTPAEMAGTKKENLLICTAFP